MSQIISKGGRFICVLLVLLCAYPLRFAVANQKVADGPVMQNFDDEALIAALGSKDKEESHTAVMEIMRRGERALPLLIRCKGVDKYFYGYGLGHHASSFLVFLPADDKTPNDGRFVTVEVAALYLISAIYHGSLEFAQAAYLTDGSQVEWQRYNTPERVKDAWASVEIWLRALRSEGMRTLRTRHQSPLAGGKVHFWGGR